MKAIVLAVLLAASVWGAGPPRQTGTRNDPVAAPGLVTPAIEGRWEGTGRIIVSWCERKDLPVSLEITQNGEVTDTIIRGELDGPIVAAEEIVRESVSLPLDFDGTVFEGAVHTSGWHVGPKSRMVLTAGITLGRAGGRE